MLLTGTSAHSHICNVCGLATLFHYGNRGTSLPRLPWHSPRQPMVCGWALAMAPVWSGEEECDVAMVPRPRRHLVPSSSVRMTVELIALVLLGWEVKSRAFHGLHVSCKASCTESCPLVFPERFDTHNLLLQLLRSFLILAKGEAGSCTWQQDVIGWVGLALASLIPRLEFIFTMRIRQGPGRKQMDSSNWWVN